MTNDPNGSCCKKRTSLEKFLIVGSCFLVLAVIGLIVGIIIVSENEKKKDDGKTGGKEIEKVCSTKGCIHAANSVLQNMDQEIDPCDDFYNFACGTFLKESFIPDDKTQVSSFTDISDGLEIKLRTLSEGIENDAPKHALLVKKFYTTCKDEEAIEKSKLAEMKSIITELGEWPVVEGESWNEEFQWHELAGQLRKLGYSTNYIIQFDVDINWKDTTQNYIQLDQPSLGIAREFLIKGKEDAKVKAYYQYMVQVAKYFGAEDTVVNELEKSLDFEIKLAKISLSREDRRNYNKLYNIMSINEIQGSYQMIPDWKTYINSVLNIEDPITAQDTINVCVKTFFAQLGTVIPTETRIIQNYVIWRVIMDSITYLNKDLRTIQLSFLSKMSGVTERSPRWKECATEASNNLAIAMGSLYVSKYFNENARTNSQTMVKDIGDQYKEILKSITWMDEETRTKALEKATKMSSHIAYPDELTNDAKLTEYYNDLDFTATTDYLKMILLRNKFHVDVEFKKLKQPVDKNHWTQHAKAAVVNAFYNSVLNSIELPAGILQGVFFNHERPRYMNYGAIGFVIGHEITHGFDDQGSQFDKDGNLKEWWNEKTKQAFKEKAQCIIDQYGNYYVEEIEQNLNGNNTQGENIADNGGIKEAYLAYKASVERDGKELPLPGLHNYTPEQMFWISAANVWCVKYTKEFLLLRVLTGVHSPGRFRTIGPMSNSEHFAKDFNCKAGSPMNPRNKCVVW